MAWLNDQLGLMTRLVQATALWPTAFWSLVALFFLLATWIENNGLTFVFFGKRLQLGAAVWRRFNLVLILLFIALALAALAVHPMVSLEVWSLYKLYGQSAALLLVPLLAAWLSTVR
ncbi:MAG: septation protein IspZ [Gammaproteobacteria bacterium]|nr:septation protein IspZ [Gammaproteobacteria bacterium]